MMFDSGVRGWLLTCHVGGQVNPVQGRGDASDQEKSQKADVEKE